MVVRVIPSGWMDICTEDIAEMSTDINVFFYFTPLSLEQVNKFNDFLTFLGILPGQTTSPFSSSGFSKNNLTLFYVFLSNL